MSSRGRGLGRIGAVLACVLSVLLVVGGGLGGATRAVASVVPMLQCLAIPGVNRAVVGSYRGAAPAESVTVSSQATYGEQPWQVAITRNDGSHYFASYVELAVDESMGPWASPVLTVAGQPVAWREGTEPVADAWVLTKSVEGSRTVWRALLPADGAALLQQKAPLPVSSAMVPVGAQVVLSAQGSVPVSASAGQLVEGAACVAGWSSQTANGATGEQKASVRVIEPVVELSKVASPAGRVTPDQVMTYTVRAQVPAVTADVTPASAFAVEIVDAVPAGVEPVGADDKPMAEGVSSESGAVWSQASRTLTWRVDRMDAGQVVERSFRARVAAQGGQVLNTASVRRMSSLPGGGGKVYADVARAEAAVTVAGSKPTLTKVVDSDWILQTARGDFERTFALWVTVPAGTTAHDLLVTDVLPKELALVEGTTTEWTCLEGCADAPLVPQATAYPESKTASGTLYAWNLGTATAAPGEDLVLLATMRVSVPAYDENWNELDYSGKTATNVATLYSNVTDAGLVNIDPANPPRYDLVSTASAALAVKKASVSISKTSPIPSIDTGADGPIDYTITITNTGMVPLTDISWRDSLPRTGSGLTVDADPNLTDTQVDRGSASGRVAFLAPGQAQTIHLTGRWVVEGWGLFDKAMLTNEARVEGYVIDGVRLSDWAFATHDTPAQGPAPKLSKRVVTPASGTVAVGQPVTYEVELRNDGPGTLAPGEIPGRNSWEQRYLALVDVSDLGAMVPGSLELADGLALRGSVWSAKDPDYDKWTSSFDLSLTRALAPGERVWVRYQVAGSSVLGSHTNTVSTSSFEGAPLSASARVQVVAPSLQVSKTPVVEAPGAITQGGGGLYQIRVFNDGGVPVHDLRIRDVLPEGLAFDETAMTDGVPRYAVVPASSSPLTFVPGANAGESVWALSVLEPGASLSIDVPVVHDGVLRADPMALNRVEVTAREVSRPVTSTGALWVNPNRVAPEMSKSADRAAAAPGEVVTYTVQAKLPKASAGALTSVTVIDQLPREMADPVLVSSRCVSGPCPVASPQAMAPATDPGSGRVSLGWFIGDWTPSATQDTIFEFTYTATVQATYGGSNPDQVPAPGTPVQEGLNNVYVMRNSVRGWFDASITAPAVTPLAPRDVFASWTRPVVAAVALSTPRLTVTKIPSVREANPAERVTYQVEVANQGSAAAYGVHLVDDLGALHDRGLTLRDVRIESVTGPGVARLENGRLVIEPASGTLMLDAGEKVTVTYSGQMPPSSDLLPHLSQDPSGAAAVVNGVAQATYTAANPATVYQSTPVESRVLIFTPVPYPTNLGCYPISQGATATVTIPISHVTTRQLVPTRPGVGAAKTMTLKISVPAGLGRTAGVGGVSILSETTAPDPQDPTRDLITVQLGSLEYRASAQLRVVVWGVPSADVRYVLTMTDATGAPQRGEAVGAAYTYMTSGSSGCHLALLDKPDLSAQFPGTQVQWPIHINAVSGDITGPVTLVDALPPYVRYTPGTASFSDGATVRGTNPAGTIDERIDTAADGTQTITWTGLADITSGQSRTVTLPLTITADAPVGTTLTNLAKLNYPALAGQSKGCAEQGWACDNGTVRVLDPRRPVVTKTADRSVVLPGETTNLTWTVTIPAGIAVSSAEDLIDRLSLFSLGSDPNRPWTFTPGRITCDTCQTTPEGEISITPPAATTQWAWYAPDLVWNFGDVQAVPYPRTVTIRGALKAPLYSPAADDPLQMSVIGWVHADQASYAQQYSAWVNVTVKVPDVKIDKSCTPNSPGPFDGRPNVRCTITVRNVSTLPAYDIEVSDTPSLTSQDGAHSATWKVLNAGGGAPRGNDGELGWTIPVLDPGATFTTTVEYGVTLAATPTDDRGISVDNIARIERFSLDEAGTVVRTRTPATATFYEARAAIAYGKPRVSASKSTRCNNPTVASTSVARDTGRMTEREAAFWSAFWNCYEQPYAPELAHPLVRGDNGYTSPYLPLMPDIVANNVRPGSTVPWVVSASLQNPGFVGTISVRDLLPAGLSYVPGSARLWSWNGPKQVVPLADPVVEAGPAGVCVPSGHERNGDTLTWSFDRNATGAGLNRPWTQGAMRYELFIVFDTVASPDLAGCAAQATSPIIAATSGSPSVGTRLPLVNTAVVDWQNLYTNEVSSQTVKSVTGVNDPLSVSKTPDGGSVRPGETGVFTVQVGWAELANAGATVVDTMTDGGRYVPGSASAVDSSGAPVALHEVAERLPDGRVRLTWRIDQLQNATRKSGAWMDPGLVTISVPVPVEVDAPDGLSIPNSVEVSTGLVDPKAGTLGIDGVHAITKGDVGELQVSNPTPPPPVSKSGPSVAVPGAEVEYAVTLDLAARRSWQNLYVVDTLPAGLTFVEHRGVRSCAGQPAGCVESPAPAPFMVQPQPDGTTKLGWWFGAVDSSSQARQVTLVYRVHVDNVAAAVAGAAFTNTVVAHASDVTASVPMPAQIPEQPLPQEFPTTSAQHTLVLDEPRVEVVKRAVDPTLARVPGDQVVYEVAVSNTSAVPAYRVEVTDHPSRFLSGLTAGADFLAKRWTADQPWLGWTIPVLAPGETVRLQYSGTVLAGYSAEGVSTVDNVVSVDQFLGLPLSQLWQGAVAGRTYPGPSAVVRVPVVTSRVGIDKKVSGAGGSCSADATASTIGREEEFCLIVTAGGDRDSAGVVVQDSLPEGWSFVPGSFVSDAARAVIAESGGDATITLGTMPVGETVTIRYRAVSSAASPKHAVNVARVDATLADGTPAPADSVAYHARDEVAVDIDTPLLTIVKTPHDQRVPVVGEPVLSWEIVVANEGLSDQHEVLVSDHLPAGLTMTATSITAPAGVSVVEAADKAHWSLPVLPARSVVKIAVTTRLDQAPTSLTEVVNEASVSSAEVGRSVWQAKATAFALASIGDRVWIDADRNGIQDGGETGLAGATVSLLDAQAQPAVDAAGHVVASVTTDATGAYLFSGLLPGTYQVRFVPPAGWLEAPVGAGDDPELDSNGSLASVVVTEGQNDRSVDAGFVEELAQISVVKKINGDDANTAPGVLVEAGSSMDVTIEVTNTGKVGLDQVTVTDDVAGVVSCPATTLPVGQTMTCQIALPAPAPGGSHVDTATATAVGGVTRQPVQAQDKAHAHTAPTPVVTPTPTPTPTPVVTPTPTPAPTSLARSGGVSPVLPLLGALAGLMGVAVVRRSRH